MAITYYRLREIGAEASEKGNDDIRDAAYRAMNGDKAAAKLCEEWDKSGGVPGWMLGRAERTHEWALGIETDKDQPADLRSLVSDLRGRLHVALSPQGRDEAVLRGLLKEAKQIAEGWDLEGLPS